MLALVLLGNTPSAQNLAMKKWNQLAVQPSTQAQHMLLVFAQGPHIH